MPSSLIIQADARRVPLPDKSVDVVIESPPYIDARTYGIKAQRKCQAWIDWMLEVVTEGCRVSRGLVLVNCAGVTRDRVYQPGPEGLLYEWWKRGGRCWRPCYWHRVGIPGSGGAEWFRADIEYVLAFTDCQPCPPPVQRVIATEQTVTKKGQPRLKHILECGHSYNRKEIFTEIACGHCVRMLPWSDNTACGHPPKWGPGGAMSHRVSDGKRVNQWGAVGSSAGMGARRASGEYCHSGRPSHVVTDNRSEESKLLVPYGGKVSNLHDDGARRNRRTGGPAGAFGNQQSSVGSRANGDAKAPYFNGNSFRVNERRADGTRMRVTSGTGEQLPNRETAFPVLANPGNLLKIIVGGGVMGSKLAHLNEAPFPEKLPEFFIRSFCPPGGIVLDRFGGSGTTAKVALSLGRSAISCDIRMSQCQLTRQRIAEPPKVKRVKKKRVPKPPKPPWTLFPVEKAG